MENQPMATCKKCLSTEDELMAKSWQLTKQNWWYLLKLLLLPVIFIVLGQVISWVLVWLGAFIDNGTVMMIIGIIAAIVVLIMSLLAVWGQFAFAYGIVHIEKSLSVVTIYKNVLGKILPLIWMVILIAALLIPGYLIFIIPGVIMMIWFSMSMYVCLDEGTWGLSALWKSKELVKGYWWSIIGRFLTMYGLMMIVIYACMFVLALGGSILALLASLLGSAGAILAIIGAVIGYAIYFIVMILVGLFASVYYVQIYQSIKAVKGDVKVTENKTVNVLIIVWLVVLVILIGLFMIFGMAAIGGLFESLDSMDVDNLLSLA